MLAMPSCDGASDVAQSLDMDGSETNPLGLPIAQPDTQVADVAAPVPAPGLSAAGMRFESCRWREVAEDGVPAHCAHRDVHPMAGANGFDIEAWCPDCGHYKVRRTPRKRPPQAAETRYYY